MTNVKDQPTIPDEPDALAKATYSNTEEDLEWMVLDRHQLPAELSELELARDEVLDNETMASGGFGDHTTRSLRELGRITGHVREFATRSTTDDIIAAATVVHLFEDHAAVSRWIFETFLKEFTEDPNPGGEGRFISAEEVQVSGFHDEAAAVYAVQEVPIGVVSSTIVDFRVGRLLGVAYVVGPGEDSHLELAQRLAHALERNIVGVVLG